MRLRAFVALIGLGVTLTAGSASAVGGGTSDGEGHPYVAFVRSGQLACSGAAISGRLVVTAAHCFDVPGASVSLTFDPNRRSPSAVFHAGTWSPDPRFCPQCAPGLVNLDTHDLAVVVLGSPAPRPRYARLPELGLADRLPNRTALDLVGYGVEDFLVGGGPPMSARPSGLRMTASAALVPGNHAFADEFLRISANQSHDNGGACRGDSGGPNLLAGTDTMIAVNSFVNNLRCSGVTYSYRLDTPAALGFIAQFS